MAHRKIRGLFCVRPLSKTIILDEKFGLIRKKASDIFSVKRGDDDDGIAVSIFINSSLYFCINVCCMVAGSTADGMRCPSFYREKSGVFLN